MSEATRRRQIEQEIRELRALLFELELETERLRAPGADPGAAARVIEVVRRTLGPRWAIRLSRTRPGAPGIGRSEALVAGLEDITRRMRAIDDRLCLELDRLEGSRKASRRSS